MTNEVFTHCQGPQEGQGETGMQNCYCLYCLGYGSSTREGCKRRCGPGLGRQLVQMRRFTAAADGQLVVVFFFFFFLAGGGINATAMQFRTMQRTHKTIYEDYLLPVDFHLAHE